MSRRLDISALLCNDDDDQPTSHVSRPSSSSSPVVSRQPPTPSPFAGLVGLDALVQAATEEQRRISGEPSQHQIARHHHQQQQQQQVHYQQPIHQQQHAVHHHQHQQPPPQRLSPKIQIRRSPWQEEQQYGPPPRQQPQSPRHPAPLDSPIDVYKSPPQRHAFEDRGHHMRQFQLMEEQKHQLELERLRAQQEMERQHYAEQERLAEIERTKLERQKIEAERRQLEEERLRLQQLERRLQEQDDARRKEDAEREKKRKHEEARRREAERRELMMQEELQRKRHEEQQQQQRQYEMLERQRRMQHQQQLAQQQQQQQERERELALHQQQQREQQQYQQRVQQQQQQLEQQQRQSQSHALQQQRPYEPLHRIEIPPGPQHPVRKVDQSPPSSKAHTQSPVLSHAHPDQRPAKKPRYSDSPSLPPILMDDKDRIARDRERMTVGEIGYGRTESPVAVPPSLTSSTSSAPRRPGSGNGVRRPVSVSDLLSPEPQPPALPTPIEPHHPPLRIISREKDPVPGPHHHHRILSPLGRRSPPGSQVGRAKAARKSDEHVSSTHALAPSASSSSTSSTSQSPAVPIHQPPPPPPSSTLPLKKPVVKEEQRQKVEETPSPMLMEAPKKPSVSVAASTELPAAPVSKPLPSSFSRHSKERHPPPLQRQEDAHDWLLEHYAETSPQLKKDHRHGPPQHTRSPSATNQARTASPVIQVKKQSPSPVIDDDDDDDRGLEQELEELLAEVEDAPPKEEAMDVDSVVAELVAETLDDDDRNEGAKSKSYQHDGPEEAMPLGVDVEDELLSLIDDKRPPPTPSSSSARRASGSSASVTASLPPPTNRIIKPAPTTLKTSEGRMTSPSTALSPAVRPASAKQSERGSMPPPTTLGSKERDHDVHRRDSTEHGTSAPKRKKDPSASKKSKGKATTTEPTPSGPSNTTDAPELAAKPRPKSSKPKKAATPSVAKPDPVPTVAQPASTLSSKAATAKTSSSTTVTSRKHASASTTSRSRSASVMPNAMIDDSAPTRGSSVAEDKGGKAEKHEEEEDSDAGNDDDNRLYCVCKTKYDQERCMIACDRCDEWYHMQCVDMPEIVADLVDQFFCPPCIEKSPGLNLRTTYKQRCLYGLKNPDPSSPRACHKPARGAFSKYCSDECGVMYMQSRIDTWAKKGGKKDKLWDSVKHAEKREGVVVRVEDSDSAPVVNGCKLDSSKADSVVNGCLKPAKPMKSKAQREKERLAKMLEQLVQTSGELKKGMEILAWREKLLELAGERAESVGQCGWDQRLCFGDEEWAEQGQSVLESYEDRDPDMDVDGQSDVDEGWWCTEDTGCSRHMGWQTTRYKDICKEKEKKEEALQKLTHRESDFRKRLNDIANPQLKKHAAPGTGSNPKYSFAKSAPPLAATHMKMANGHSSKSKASGGDALKKGKKRKAPAS